MQVMKFVNEKTGEVICRLCGQTNVIQPVVYPSGRAVYPQGSFRCISPTCLGRRRQRYQRRGANRMPYDDQQPMESV